MQRKEANPFQILGLRPWLVKQLTKLGNVKPSTGLPK